MAASQTFAVAEKKNSKFRDMDKEIIMNLISDNRTQEALKILKEQLANHDLQIEVVLLSRRLESLNQKVRLGIVEERERNKEENQINHSIVSLLEKIELVEYDFELEKESGDRKNHNFKNTPKESNTKINIADKNINPIRIPYGLIIFCLICGSAIYYFYFKPKPPIDCNTSLTFRNNSSVVETNGEFFNNLRYTDITGFSISFEKGKNDTTNNTWIDVMIEFEKKPNDSISYWAEYYKYDAPNLHFNFKNGREAYVLTTFDRYYSIRDVHHIHFDSDTLSAEIVNKITQNNIERVSLFNNSFNLTPNPNITMPFEDDPNDISLSKLSQNLNCLLKYKSAFKR